MIQDGQKIFGPDGQGYEFYCERNRAVLRRNGSLYLSLKHFRPFGGAPEPCFNEPVPGWLVSALETVQID